MFNDLNKFLKNISDSDVVSIVFFNLNVSLVIDRRISEGNVLIKIFPIASSADNRIKILNNLRPDLKEVKNFVIIPWYSYIKVLTEAEVWDKLLKNILYPVNAKVDIMLQNAFKELQLKSLRLRMLLLGTDMKLFGRIHISDFFNLGIEFENRIYKWYW